MVRAGTVLQMLNSIPRRGIRLSENVHWQFSIGIYFLHLQHNKEKEKSVIKSSIFYICYQPVCNPLSFLQAEASVAAAAPAAEAKMVKAVRVHELGGPEVLKWEEVDVGEPKEGEIRVKNKAIGVNFIDVYFRKGVYKTDLPFTPGREAVGVVTAVGPGLTGRKIGDVVAYAGNPMGSYAEEQILPARVAVPVPPSLDFKVAASVMLKGMTAHMLLRQCFKVEPGHTVLVHAAAGGVGSLLCQWAKNLGATVIGTVSNEEKAAQAKEDGCHHIILYTKEDFVAAVNNITSGKGVNVVYDSVGKDTYQGSLQCLASRGYMVSFGQSSGLPDPIPLTDLVPKSLFITRPTLMQYAATREELLESAGEVFSLVSSGLLKVRVNHVYPLSEAARVHADLEARKTSGSIVLVPDCELPASLHLYEHHLKNVCEMRTAEVVLAVAEFVASVIVFFLVMLIYFGFFILMLCLFCAMQVLKWEEVEVGEPKEGEIRVKNKAVGVNFIDVYFRKGVYKADLPFTPGMEAVGVVTAVGPGLTDRKIGDVVAYAGNPMGSYAEEQILPAAVAVPVPSSVDLKVAASVMLKGMTAHMLLRQCFKVEPGHIVLVHAAAGGVGSLLCQWAKNLGATVIGTVSNEEKAAQAKEDGCHHIIIYKKEDFVAAVNDITSGKGVNVVYDSVGKDTFQFPVQFRDDCSENRLLTRPSMMHYTAAREELLESAGEQFSAPLCNHTLEMKVNVIGHCASILIKRERYIYCCRIFAPNILHVDGATLSYRRAARRLHPHIPQSSSSLLPPTSRPLSLFPPPETLIRFDPSFFPALSAALMLESVPGSGG
ncbi:Quinone oxidoreductase-like protein [Apostasia shenzhenica]|uniref:Probable quinone oxidoreductase n=1 Tax=Apostasia shenzhenica TaxID=1088818 RepID=A0A2I0AZY5_9ASPA|nr:Quinone oxidoreductase-like protein [Apostasia shenzhenica]